MKRFLLMLVLTMVLGISEGCAHYSNKMFPPTEKIINAPPDVVYQESLKILPEERIEILIANEVDRTIFGKKGINFWTDGDGVHIKIEPYDGNRSILNLEISANNQLLGWGYQEMLGKILFSKIKENSENMVQKTK
jgi:hypothetical protein